MRIKTLTLIGAFCALACTSEAHALSLYAGLLGGYGFAPKKASAEPDPYAPAIGGDAGITLPVIPIYVGARVVWFVGDSNHATLATGGAMTAEVKVSESYLTYGIDLGYDLELGPLVLRPELGVGRATLNVNVAGTGGFSMIPDKSKSSLYLAPAAELLIKLGLLYVGGEARFYGLTAKQSHNGVALLAHLGLTI